MDNRGIRGQGRNYLAAYARNNYDPDPEFLPVGRELAVHDDLLRLDRDVAAGGEVAQDAAHHLARAADARRDLRLGETVRDDAAAAALDGAFLEILHQAAVDVLQREVHHARRERAHLADQLAQQVFRELRVAGEQRLDVALRDDEEAR